MQTVDSNWNVPLWLLHNEKITSLDPLKLDDKLEQLHLFNRNADTEAISQLLYLSLPLPDELSGFSYETSIAAMRDLGFFIGILKKHNIEPVEAVPELEYVLLELMSKTDLPPRDTLLHYTVWNPCGPRMRTYTGLNDEKQLIESVKIAVPSLLEAIVQLDALHEEKLQGPEFEKVCSQVREKMEAMVQGVVHAKRNVSPMVFANELRFYYDPIKVDYNKDYIGPGAVEMPMFVFDHLLWSCDCSDPAYTAFKEGYLPYSLRSVRDIYWRFHNKASLLSRVQDQLEENPCLDTLQAAQSVLDLCTVLKSFRMPHKKLAESAYTQDDEHHRNNGSGGYSPAILQHIIELQNEKIDSLQKSTIKAKTQHFTNQ